MSEERTYTIHVCPVCGIQGFRRDLQPNGTWIPLCNHIGPYDPTKITFTFQWPAINTIERID